MSATPKPRAGEHTTARQALLDAAVYPGSGLSFVPGPLAMEHADELDALRERERALVEEIAVIANSKWTNFEDASEFREWVLNRCRSALAKHGR